MDDLERHVEIIDAIHEPLKDLLSKIPQPETFIDTVDSADIWQGHLSVLIEEIGNLIYYYSYCSPETRLRSLAGAASSPKRRRLESIVKLSRKLYNKVSAARQDPFHCMELAIYDGSFIPGQDVEPKHLFAYIDLLPGFADKLEAFLAADRPDRGRPCNEISQPFTNDLGVLFIHFLRKRPPKTKSSKTHTGKTLFYEILEISLKGFPGAFVSTAVIDKLILGLTLPPEGAEKIWYKIIYSKINKCLPVIPSPL